jgi:nucleotide-binding universal stress UspA family protein
MLSLENPYLDITCEMIDTNTIADTIVNVAKKTNTDLIIMGSHGKEFRSYING